MDDSMNGVWEAFESLYKTTYRQQQIIEALERRITDLEARGAVVELADNITRLSLAAAANTGGDKCA